MKTSILVVLIYLISPFSFSQNLMVIEQDFKEASKRAKNESKLLFIDFYTTWCGPCKKLDKIVFQNESVQNKLAEDFILLRYDAENDSIFNLSKKYHVNSYPSAVILNPAGFVLGRKYGFSGENFESLSKNVLDFTAKALELNNQNKIIKGYSNSIDLSEYPNFYINYINRTDKKAKHSKEFRDYWSKKHNLFAEEYFSVLTYFASDAPTYLADEFLKNREKYVSLYGETDVSVALTLFSFGKFDEAIESKNQEEFDKAVAFIKKALSKETLDKILPMFKKQFEEKKI